MTDDHLTETDDMTFKSFDTNNNDEQSLPWTQEYVDQHPQHVGQTLDVTSVKLSDKGMVITTPVTRGFLYKSSVTYSHVLEFVEAWSGKKLKSPLLQIQLTGIRPFMVLGVDDDRHGVWSVNTNNTWTQGYATTKDNPTLSTNPLPLPTPPSVSVPTDVINTHTPVQDASAYLPQTSQEMPLEASASSLNSVKGRNTSRRK